MNSVSAARSLVGVVLGAQLRILRNRFPRSSTATVIIALVSALWYLGWAAGAYSLATWLQALPPAEAAQLLPVMLLICFLGWQFLPLLMLSTGSSLEWERLLVFPIRVRDLFWIELGLRITAAVEVMLMLAGLIVGLSRHPALTGWHPLLLVVWLPFNLAMALMVRSLAIHVFGRGWAKEMVAVAALGLAAAPMAANYSPFAGASRRIASALAGAPVAPWRQLADLTRGIVSPAPLLGVLAWLVLVFAGAYYAFRWSLRGDRGGPAHKPRSQLKGARQSWWVRLVGVLPDPYAALIEKEVRSLVRAPRFRVYFAIACVFGVFLFLSLLSRHAGRGDFWRANQFPLVNLYALLIAGELVVWNSFGFDRQGVAVYLVAPVPFRQVLRVKNLIAAAVLGVQMLLLYGICLAIDPDKTGNTLVTGSLVSGVAVVYFLGCGNLTSVLFARPVDPRQVFKRQARARTQLWLFVSYIGLVFPIGLAFLAGWAFQSDWAQWAVLTIDLAAACAFYGVATDSALRKSVEYRDRFLAALVEEPGLIGS